MGSTVQWVWPIIAYVFILYSEIRTYLSYGHPLIPRRPDKRGLTVCSYYTYGTVGGLFSGAGKISSQTVILYCSGHVETFVQYMCT